MTAATECGFEIIPHPPYSPDMAPSDLYLFKKLKFHLRDTQAGSNESKKGGKVQESIQSIPHLTQDTTWESEKSTINITNKSQDFSPFPAGDHKAAINSRARKYDKHKTYITQMIRKRTTALERSVKYFTGGLNRFHSANLTLSSDVDQDSDVWCA